MRLQRLSGVLFKSSLYLLLLFVFALPVSASDVDECLPETAGAALPEQHLTNSSDLSLDGDAGGTNVQDSLTSESRPVSLEEHIRDDQRVHEWLAQCRTHIEQNRYAEAAALVQKALEIDWNEPAAYDLLTEIEQVSRSQLASLIARGKHYFAAGDFARAALMFSRALMIDSSCVDCRTQLSLAKDHARSQRAVEDGLKFFIAEDYHAALEKFDEALRINPLDSAAAGYQRRVRTTLAKRQSGTLDDIRASESDWQSYTEALTRFREGELDSAEGIWLELLTRYPNNAALESNLEQLRLRRDNSSDQSAVSQR